MLVSVLSIWAAYELIRHGFSIAFGIGKFLLLIFIIYVALHLFIG